jgi:hypothetical protein
MKTVTREKYSITTSTKFAYGNQKSLKAMTEIMKELQYPKP